MQSDKLRLKKTIVNVFGVISFFVYKSIKLLFFLNGTDESYLPTYFARLIGTRMIQNKKIEILN
ncbi:hypothetical protein SAMN04488514_111100 [Kriegella aquimaris]|uniref:Uncharacterized protein n=1 Tax=Kriegella aquimaris TaxID=192904 RepID=A0A1G9UN30_9FLAO|nr:hypothetical protein SAMN04488514_111100 [Kriegella aquimaris]